MKNLWIVLLKSSVPVYLICTFSKVFCVWKKIWSKLWFWWLIYKLKAVYVSIILTTMNCTGFKRSLSGMIGLIYSYTPTEQIQLFEDHCCQSMSCWRVTSCLKIDSWCFVLTKVNMKLHYITCIKIYQSHQRYSAHSTVNVLYLTMYSFQHFWL